MSKSTSRPRWPKTLSSAVVLFLGLTVFFRRSLNWFLLKRLLRARFGRDNWITTKELADWLANRSRPQPKLFDVRTMAEWQVSRLPGAQQVNPAADVKTVANGLAKDALIVTYCSVGYRSGVMARRLREMGYTNVQNLEGSIFEWANQGRPLIRDGARVKRVHPYSLFWERLLKREMRAPLC
jgi:rhodanese-related sulfurtransferase